MSYKCLQLPVDAFLQGPRHVVHPPKEDVTDKDPPVPNTAPVVHRRVIHDLVGRIWTVYEAALTYDRRGTLSLVFESNDIVRRVRNFPPDWSALSHEELLALSETS